MTAEIESPPTTWVCGTIVQVTVVKRDTGVIIELDHDRGRVVGVFNVEHADPELRADGRQALRELATAAGRDPADLRSLIGRRVEVRPRADGDGIDCRRPVLDG